MNSLLNLLNKQDCIPEYINEIKNIIKEIDSYDMTLLISYCFSYGLITGKRIERMKKKNI